MFIEYLKILQFTKKVAQICATMSFLLYKSSVSIAK